MGNKELLKEVEEMDKVFSEPDGAGDTTDAPETDAPGTDAPSTDAPSTDAPGTEAPSTDAPKTDAPSTDAPATDAPATDAPTTDAPIEETEREKQLREQVEELRTKVEKLSGPKTEPPKTEAPTTDAPIEEQDFVGDTNLEELVTDPKKLNALLNKVYAKGAVDSRAATVETTQSIQGTVRDSVEAHTVLKETTDNFYKDNKDLQPFKKVVAAVFDDVQTENPNKKLPELLTIVATESRKRLELKEPVVEKKRKKQHQLPRKTGSHTRGLPPDDSKGVAGELDDMDKALA